MTTLFPVARMLDAALNNSCEPWRDTRDTTNFVPRADVLEGEKEFVVVMDLPGVAREDLEINLENQALTVKAAKTNPVPEGFELRRHERADEVSFGRTFNLGTSVENEQISATLDAGVLRITLPKSEKSLPRRITIK